jgi:hypothetical protein
LANGIGRGRYVVGFGRESRKTAHGFVAHVLVRIGARDICEYRRIVEPGDRRAAYARVGVFARQRAKRVGLFRSYFVHRRRTHRRVRVLPAGSGTEFFENAHAPLTVG